MAAYTKTSRHFLTGYWLVVGILAFLFVAALGPGIYTSDPTVWYFSWQRMLFSPLCHQNPTRSFYINGVQMAVCTRCFGIYLSLFIGSIIFPLLSRIVKLEFKGGKVLLAISVLIIIIDFLGNALGLWTNTDISRLITGVFLGLSVTYMMSSDFYKYISTSINLEEFAWNR